MSLDFQQVRQQVQQLGAEALQRQARLENLRVQADDLLGQYTDQVDKLREQVQTVVHLYDPSLRCALPVCEALMHQGALPPLPAEASVLAADGSQIFMDRHAEVQYGLVNAGAILMRHGSAQPPVTHVVSTLLYHEAFERMSEATLALRRDLDERRLLAELATQADPPVVTFTDGPMELWGSVNEGGEQALQFQKSLEQYLEALERLHTLGTITAGYVDRPGADLVVRLLEVALLLEQAKNGQADLKQIRKLRPLQGVTDRELYREILLPGERSAVFAMQSQSAKQYTGALALHFFYLNVGTEHEDYLARVEIPAWVADDPDQVDTLHAILVSQCRILGPRPYPYLLHRAHETAVVSLDEKEQVTQMVVNELLHRGAKVPRRSYKQSAKDVGKRTRYGT
jgi:hypothetical protein